MTDVAIVFHSGYGHTSNQAEAVRDGAASVAGVTAVLIAIDQDGEISDAQWQQLDAATAIIFGSPTYMGSVSWQFKKFADASSQRWFNQRWKDKIAAGFTNSASLNGDKHSTLHYLITLAMQHSMSWVGTGLMPANTKDAQRNDINYLGSFGGLMAQSTSDAGTDESPPPGDLATARAFGQRIAQVSRGVENETP
jgi:NAD(P)H dehydrogenase (quinone)